MSDGAQEKMIHVLLVEDHRLLLAAMGQALTASGFLVTAAETGDQAASILEAGTKADILLSDIQLPGTLGGLDLALCVQQRYPSMAILLQTGFVPGDSGGYRVLLKPFGPDFLVAAIREAVECRAIDSRATSDPGNH
jgi:DNA-binding NtrC family response regulator